MFHDTFFVQIQMVIWRLKGFVIRVIPSDSWLQKERICGRYREGPTIDPPVFNKTVVEHPC